MSSGLKHIKHWRSCGGTPRVALSHRGLHIEEHGLPKKLRKLQDSSPRGRASEYAVDLGRHDEIVLM